MTGRPVCVCACVGVCVFGEEAGRLIRSARYFRTTPLLLHIRALRLPQAH